jgi:hypothetical protein
MNVRPFIWIADCWLSLLTAARIQCYNSFMLF